MLSTLLLMRLQYHQAPTWVDHHEESRQTAATHYANAALNPSRTRLLLTSCSRDSPVLRQVVRSNQHGGVAALTAIARCLQVAVLIDRLVPVLLAPDPVERLSVVQTMVLAASNRALHPACGGWEGNRDCHPFRRPTASNGLDVSATSQC